MEHFNKLSPAEAERLAILAEECGEVIQVVGKILRHGFQSTHPDGGPTPELSRAAGVGLNELLCRTTGERHGTRLLQPD